MVVSSSPPSRPGFPWSPTPVACSGNTGGLECEVSWNVQLLGRDREREALNRLLTAARTGRGGVLVVHGEPGVGKTALLDDVAATAARFRVLRTAGSEGEVDFPFA